MCATAKWVPYITLQKQKNGNISIQIIVSIIDIGLITQNLPFLIEISLSLYCFVVEFQSLNKEPNNADLIYRPTGLKSHLLAHGLISEKYFFHKMVKNSPFSVISPWAFTRDYTVIIFFGWRPYKWPQFVTKKINYIVVI